MSPSKKSVTKSSGTKKRSHSEPVIKFVGAGAFKCVIEPAIPCDGKKLPKGYVSAIATHEELRNEQKTYSIIQKVDPQHKFTLKPPQVCELKNQITVLNHPVINNNCKDIVNYYEMSRGDDVTGNMVMKREGISVGDIKFSSLTDYKRNKMIRALPQLVEAIIAINRAGYAHYDIKPDNILYDSKQNKYILIDFGISAPVEDGYSKNYFKQPYSYWPPDMTRNYMTITNSIGDKLLTYDPKFRLWFMQNMTAAKQNMLKNSKDYIEVAKNKVDIYSLGIAFYRLGMKIMPPRTFRKFVIDVVTPMVDPNAYYRADGKEALSLLNEFLFDTRTRSRRTSASNYNNRISSSTRSMTKSRSKNTTTRKKSKTNRTK